MDRIVILGGLPLKGEVEISGAKNSALPILASTLLSTGVCRLSNVPKLRDVNTLKKLLTTLGVRIDNPTENTLVIDPREIYGYEAPYDLVKTMRASVLVLGPLLARFGRAQVSLPGGCAIGARPIHLHLSGLERLGATIQIDRGYVFAESQRLKGARIYLDIPTVTGTMNLMMAASLARGTTRLENAACEPEVAELAVALNQMGAKIAGAGTDHIVIDGVDTLAGLDYRIMPDRIETGTFLVGAAITGGEVTLKRCRPDHLEAVIEKMTAAGVQLECGDDQVKVKRNGPLQAVDIKTGPYPAFATDMQAQFMSLMTLAEGTSVITETVFENRFMHVAELRRMGADIKVQGNNAVVRGVKRLSGAPLMATDLRASASLLLAGLAATGETVVSRIYHLDRGYEQIERKLNKLGARMVREPEPHSGT